MAIGHSSKGSLWFGASIFTLAAIPLLWMGKLPADLPSAKDPAARRRHPQYRELERRGRIAGVGMILLIVLDIALSVALIRGL
ncbi:hypothetical protein [Kitasatospora sp. NBC_01266]|uniref:hypothetical protein n=1 Tax=Kitasatospora sp. NBC_01266 TaxID=2903572 RepID=UPI002E3544C7|nr:hypothetical protein [Kitasatospora sp. NBC_01266]